MTLWKTLSCARRSGTWLGVTHSDSRGESTSKMEERTTLIVLNTPTFRSPGYKGSILVSLVDGWRDLEDCLSSDHQYIRFKIWACTSPRSPCKWNIAKVNIEALGTGRTMSKNTSGSGGTTDNTVVNPVITTACSASMLGRTSSRDKSSIYW